MGFKHLRFVIIALTVTAIFCSCVKPFNPTVSTVNQNILVVEGFINTGGDTTKIVLSHTITIGNKNSSVPESGAIVTVEDASGAPYPIPETIVKGNYASKGALSLTSGKQYRLRIKTTGGKTYLSDLVAPKIAPPIDSIGYINAPGRMKIYVNSHDNNGQSLYYKYSYSEAWQFHAKYYSGYISNGKDSVLVRTPAQDIYTCYGTDSATNIVLNSTASLSKDVVYQFPITTLSDTSEKLELRYSILVSEQILTKDGYVFWQNMLKNTEQLGSIFDAQPSAISGNIHNISNATEPVIGFISAGTVQKKRIYINKTDLPANYIPGYPYGCPYNFYDAENLKLNPPPSGPTTIIWAYYAIIQQPSPNRIIQEVVPQYEYTFVNASCSDCTIRGAHNPPAYWKP